MIGTDLRRSADQAASLSRNAPRNRGSILTQIRVVNESPAIPRQLVGQLAQIRLDNPGVDMHQRIKAEDKIGRSAGNHPEAAAIVDMTIDSRIRGEPPATDVD